MSHYFAFFVSLLYDLHSFFYSCGLFHDIFPFMFEFDTFEFAYALFSSTPLVMHVQSFDEAYKNSINCDVYVSMLTLIIFIFFKLKLILYALFDFIYKK